VRAALLAIALAGCNVVQIQQAGIVRGLRAQGLELQHAELGDDHVRFFHRRGEGTPVVLVHGFGGAAHWQWHAVVPGIDAPIVMPDLLWFGGSSSRNDDFTLGHQVRALIALLDHLGYERVDIVGISYGGLVAYELAASHPERVRRLVMVDSPGREYTREVYRDLCERFGVDDMSEVLVPEDERGVRVLLELAYEEPPWIPDYVLVQIRAALYSQNREEQRALLRTLLRDLDRLREGPDPTAETLVVWGEHDTVFPLEIGRRLAARLSARLEVIERARHAPNVERRDPARVPALSGGHCLSAGPQAGGSGPCTCVSALPVPRCRARSPVLVSRRSEQAAVDRVTLSTSCSTVRDGDRPRSVSVIFPQRSQRIPDAP
jgi:pimeloyl-ACP methyl ester carboxylesterase